VKYLIYDKKYFFNGILVQITDMYTLQRFCIQFETILNIVKSFQSWYTELVPKESANIEKGGATIVNFVNF
jgi:hypothetical protein